MTLPSLMRPSLLAILLAVLVGAGPSARPALAQATIGGPIEVEDEEPAAAPQRPHRESRREREQKAQEAAEAAKTEAAAEAKPSELSAPERRTVEALTAQQRQVQLPTETQGSLVEAWQKRAQFLQSRDAARVAEAEREVERIKEALDLENLFGVSAALVREAEVLLAQGNATEALGRCTEAAKVAPALAQAHLCVARATLAKSSFDLAPAFAASRRALSATLSDVRGRRNAVADELLTALIGLLLACAVLALLVIARHAKLFLHDFHHLFPKGTSRWQTGVVALVLLSLPALLGGGALGTAVAAAAAVALVLTRAEAVALAASFVVVALAQLAMQPVVQAGAFGPVAQDVYLLERGDAPAAAAARLQERLDAGRGDYPTAFALGRYFKRMGKLKEAQATYEVAMKQTRSAGVLNNLANVRFLGGDLEAAKQLYHEANQSDAALAAPLWNVAKIYYKETRLDLGQQARERARDLDPERAARMQVEDDLRANHYLVDVPLDDEAMAQLADRELEALGGLAPPAWALATGRASSPVAVALAFAAALLVALGQGLQRRLRPSSRCEKCGRAVCGRCDPELGQTAGMCGQCISVFVRRTGVDAPDRIRKELEVRRFRRRQRLVVRFLGVLVGGAGHVFSGRVLGGALFLALFGLVASQVLFWNGFLRAPVAVPLTSSAFRVGLYGALFLLVYGLSVRHLLKHEEPD